MRLAVVMLVTAYAYLVLRLADVFPRHSHSSVYFAVVMGLLTTVNLMREWREHRES